MAPPFPDASQPSKSTHSGGPIFPSVVRPPSQRRSCSRRSPAASRRSASSALLSLSVRSSSSRRPTGAILSASRLHRHPPRVVDPSEQERVGGEVLVGGAARALEVSVVVDDQDAA